MTPTICELANPSDAVTFIVTDKWIAAAGIILLGNGKYALIDADDNQIVPMFFFGGWRDWMKENGIPDPEAFVGENSEAVADFLLTYAYGSISDRQDFDKAVSMMTPEKAAEFRAWHADKKRTSMNNIGAACEQIAKQLKERTAKGQSDEAGTKVQEK
jgi:hypothetical protein